MIKKKCLYRINSNNNNDNKHNNNNKNNNNSNMLASGIVMINLVTPRKYHCDELDDQWMATVVVMSQPSGFGPSTDMPMNFDLRHCDRLPSTSDAAVLSYGFG